MTLSGYTVTRDCIEGDFCFELTIRCLASICDEVVVADAGSVDGTRERLDQLCDEIHTLRIVDYIREEPFSDRKFLTRWMNWTREHLNGTAQLYLDADEIIDHEDRASIRRLAETGVPYWCPRLNFWGDHRHIVPSGVVCGDEVVRIGPKKFWMPSDEPCQPEAEIRTQALKGGPTIFHYGFIRQAKGFLHKSEWFQKALVGSFDSRLKRAIDTGEDWRVLAPCPKPTLPYNGRHPSIVHEWLKERGYQP